MPFRIGNLSEKKKAVCKLVLTFKLKKKFLCISEKSKHNMAETHKMHSML